MAKSTAMILSLLMVSVDQEFWKGPAEQFWFRAPHEALVSWWLGLEQLGGCGYLFPFLQVILGLLHVVSCIG